MTVSHNRPVASESTNLAEHCGDPRLERHLQITPLQAAMLQQAQQQVNAAQAQLHIVAGTILAGFGIQQAEVLRIDGGDRPMLVVRVPEAASGDGDNRPDDEGD